MKIINTKERKIWISELDAWVSMEEYLDTIKNTIENETVGIHPDGYQMKYTNCSDQDGNRWKEPYVKVYNKHSAETVTDALNDVGIQASVDCYEDDDGAGDGGRPIIRKLWSVRLGIKIKAE